VENTGIDPVTSLWGVGLRFNASSQGRGGRVSQSDTVQPEPHIVFALIGYLRLIITVIFLFLSWGFLGVILMISNYPYNEFQNGGEG